MKTAEEAIRDAARAISDDVHDGAEVANTVRRVVRAIDAAGYHSVPEKPTDAMYQAMSAPNGWDDQGNPRPATWMERWKAGLAARPRLPGVER